MKKRIRTGIALVLAAAVLSACKSQGTVKQNTENGSSEQVPVNENEPGQEVISFTPGVYQATASGHNGPMVVEVTVTESEITDVIILEHFESNGVLQVIDVVPNAIVREQSLAVDTVAGATFCGRGVISAATDCLTQAGGNLELLKVKKEQEPVKSETYEADVIVIGGGGSGLAAAVSAHQSGADVIVLEKLGMVGGSTIFSGGAMNAADPERSASIEMTESNESAIQKLLDKEPFDKYEEELQKVVTVQFEEHKAAGNSGLFDSAQLHMLQTYNGGDYEGNPELITILCENALEATEWMESLGAEWKDNLSAATGSLWQRSHYGTSAAPDGFNAVMPYKKYIDEQDGIEIHLETKALELIVENGSVVGVKAEAQGTEMIYMAKNGVVMATGGFGANVEMRQKYNTQWDNLGSEIGCSNHMYAAQGDGIVMGESVGAQLVDMGLIQLHPSGSIGTGLMTGNPKTAGLNRIFVNNEGNRFVAEDSRRDDLVNATYAQEGSTMWIVADATRYPADEQPIKNEVLLGNTLQADTIEELAEMMGVDPVNLQNSIDEYNQVVDGGEDPFGLKTYDQKLGNAPYYAARRCPTVHHTMGGLKIDTECRVLDQDDKPITGLYAAGEVTGDIHGANRLGGNAIADISVFGKIAGMSAAEGR